jgi:hypothetical protein
MSEDQIIKDLNLIPIEIYSHNDVIRKVYAEMGTMRSNCEHDFKYLYSGSFDVLYRCHKCGEEIG